MSTSADAFEQRKLRSIARRYERDGYRVTVLRQGGISRPFSKASPLTSSPKASGTAWS